MAKTKSEEENKSNRGEVQHVVTFLQSLYLNSPTIVVCFPHRMA